MVHAEQRIAVHEGVKYSCGQCGKEFTTQGALKRHRRATHKGVKYPCGQCGKEFSSQGSDLLQNTEEHFMKE